MNEYTKIICPDCGAVNGPGAPACHTCGISLARPGFAARRDDDDEDDEPRPPAKKPARPEDAVRKGAPPPKKRPVGDEDDEPRRPAKKRRDDDDDDEPRRPKKKSRRDDDDEEPASLRDNTILNMFFPVGVNLWAMGSFLFAIFGALAIGGAYVLGGATGSKSVAYGLAALGTVMCLLALPLGGLSFILRPKKATYGGVTSYMRAIIGLLVGLLGLVGGAGMIWYLSTINLR